MKKIILIVVLLALGFMISLSSCQSKSGQRAEAFNTTQSILNEYQMTVDSLCNYYEQRIIKTELDAYDFGYSQGMINVLGCIDCNYSILMERKQYDSIEHHLTILYSHNPEWLNAHRPFQ